MRYRDSSARVGQRRVQLSGGLRRALWAPLGLVCIYQVTSPTVRNLGASWVVARCVFTSQPLAYVIAGSSLKILLFGCWCSFFGLVFLCLSRIYLSKALGRKLRWLVIAARSSGLPTSGVLKIPRVFPRDNTNEPLAPKTFTRTQVHQNSLW